MTRRELATEFSEVPDTDDDETVLESPIPPRKPAQVYSVRVPVEKIELLRQVAVARHEAHRALIRRWVLERIEMVAPDDGWITEDIE